MGVQVDQELDSDITSAEPQTIESSEKPGLIRRTFQNRFGHWRAGWRLLVYIIGVYAIGKSISAVLKLFMANPSEAPFASWAHSVLWLITDAALIGAGLILLRYFDRRRSALLGLGFRPGWLRELALGLAGGVGASGLLVVALTVSRAVSLGVSPQAGESLASLPRYLIIFLLAAAAEELIFRGYPLQVLAEGSRRWIAGVLLCLLFTMGHADNPDVTMVGIFNIFLASVMLTVLYFQTRRLWLPIAMHLSWNLTQSWLWGFDVSGIKIEDQLFIVRPTGNELITGGEFGLEGSILSTVLFAAVIVWLLARPVLRPTAEVAALWEPYPAGFGMEPVLSSDDEQESDGVSLERSNVTR
jgi:membrane protease YdiL (CAAX protease family)